MGSPSDLTNGFNDNANGIFGQIFQTIFSIFGAGQSDTGGMSGENFNISTLFQGFLHALGLGSEAAAESVAIQTRAPSVSAVSRDNAPNSLVPASMNGQNIVVWGDSIANGLAPHIDGEASLNNLGQNGRGIGIGNDVPEMPSLHSGDVVIISMGTNDLLSLSGNENAIERYGQRLTQMAESIRAQGGTPVILGPNNVDENGYTGNMLFDAEAATRYNEAQAQLNHYLESNLSNAGVLYVPTTGIDRSSDGLHPSANGFEQITARIDARLESATIGGQQSMNQQPEPEQILAPMAP